MLDLALIAAGFVLLVTGGETLVRGAVNVARALGVSPLMIGITLVGFGTSMPELVTSLQAAWIGSPGIAVGNVVGSNIANVLLIIGVSAVILPMACHPASLKRDGTVMALATLAFLVVALFGKLSRIEGVLFVAALIAYVVVTYRRERVAPAGDAGAGEDAEPVGPGMPIWLSLLFATGGIVLTVVGARLLVTGAVGLATSYGVSETVIGLTLVALGTSLPELVTAIMAALRGQTDIAFGNVVGSNIYNILFILGATGIIVPIAIPEEILRIDVWVMVATTAALLVFAWSSFRVTRIEGAIFLFGYAGYIIMLATRAT